ncbi:MAG: hypothetical protein OWT27_02080 [Firmicutes bacterium]|nr:hypothetical protein [Bacillota bacterium]
MKRAVPTPRQAAEATVSNGYLMAVGQWVIAFGAVGVAIGLTINARLAKQKLQRGEVPQEEQPFGPLPS